MIPASHGPEQYTESKELITFLHARLSFTINIGNGRNVHCPGKIREKDYSTLYKSQTNLVH
jgi:hypothetical protein